MELGILQSVAFLAVVLGLAFPLGAWMARSLEGKGWIPRLLGPVERLLYRAAGVDPAEEMGWKSYAAALLLFNAAGLAVVFLLQIVQGSLPLNPDRMGAVSWHSALNTAVSFATNTNWQGYGGETTMSHLTQVLGLTVQNFLSAATAVAVLAALARGFARRTASTVGSFWVDMVRTTLHILLPLSIVLAVLLVSQGVVQTFEGKAEIPALGEGAPAQVIARGPAASQVAIKQLGTNGGGFFNVNSAHPLENPTPFSNFLELVAILLLPAACCPMFGNLLGDRRQGRALLAAMVVMFVPVLVATHAAESAPSHAMGVPGLAAGGNMEGKEVRFGVDASADWAVATTAASNGSVNAMHDSFTPLGGLGPLWLMLLGEVVFGGVGSGLYGLAVFAVVAVFLCGLMVGRTPEYLGKKIEAFEMKMASAAVLAPCIAVLLGTAVAVSTEAGRAGVFNPGPHGFSEVLYAFASASNNNGSAFAGLGANTVFYNLALAIVMLVGRFAPILAVLAMAGSLALKKTVPEGPGTLATHGPLFGFLLIATVLLVGALTFLPALALGPIVEHFHAVR